jgi:hypothetical protein
VAPTLSDVAYQTSGHRRLKRSVAVATGAAAIAVYAIGSLLSARLGVQPAPMLDGLSPPPPYKWVDPPPELAADNEEPSGGSFTLDLTRKGSTAGAFSTPDSQATVIVSQGSIAAADGQESVRIELTPLDPDRLASPPSELEFAGNAYRITATYEPGEQPVTEVTAGADQRVVLVYPAAAGDPEHEPVTLLSSPDGEEWTRLETNDASAIQQAQATFETFGYFVVVRPPAETGLSTSAIGVVILSVVLLALGALVIMRNVRRGRSAPPAAK